MPARIYWTRQSREDLREIIQGDYRIIYRADDARADILTVYHGARLLDETDFDM